MKPASRRSLLQVRILLRLEQGPARTVSELAVAVGASRPSVSRSLKTLRNDRLVARRRNGWTLTLTGEEEAKRCNQELSRVVESLRRTFKGVASVELMKAGNSLSESLVGGVLAKTMASTSLAPFPSATLGGLPKVVAQPFSSMLGDVISQSVAPLADTQRTLSTDRVTLLPIREQENPQEILERSLTDLNPDLVDKWQGSWQALSDSNPDRLSQAASSYRELIRMVLDELAPDVEVDPSKQGSKRKMQVRQVLDGREGNFAEAMVEGLPRLYDFLSKSAHTSYRNEVAVQAALMAGDGLLLILLSSRRIYHS